MPLVDAGHVVVHVPALGLDRVDHGGHVRGDAHHQAGVPHALEIVVDRIQLARFEQVIRDFAMVRDPDGAGAGQFLHIVRLGTEGQIVQAAALGDQAPVQLGVLAARLPAIDAHVLAAAQGLENLLRACSIPAWPD